MTDPEQPDNRIAFTESRQPRPDDFKDERGVVSWVDFRLAAAEWTRTTRWTPAQKPPQA